MKFLFRLFSFLRFYPLSCLFVAAIWVACFMTVPKTPLDDVAFMDKWVHFLMYGSTCAVIYLERERRDRTKSVTGAKATKKPDGGKRKKLVSRLAYSWLAPVMMSGLIEILQATCTGGRRSGDWLDFAANTVGATLGVATGILLAACHATCRKG